MRSLAGGLPRSRQTILEFLASLRHNNMVRKAVLRRRLLAVCVILFLVWVSSSAGNEQQVRVPRLADVSAPSLSSGGGSGDGGGAPLVQHCLGDPALKHCHRWLTEVIPNRPMDVVLFGNELWQQFPLNAYGGIEASVETMAWALHHLKIPFWVITPGRGEETTPKYPFSVLETKVAPNGRGGLVGDYTREALEIMRLRKDVKGAYALVEGYPNVSRPLIAWGQSDWSQIFSQEAVVTITTHHDGGGPVKDWDRNISSVGHRFLSVDQRKRWLTPENERRTRIIPHGLLPDEFVSCPDGNYFLWVASLDWGWEEKGLHIFVEMAKRHPERHFVAYGHATRMKHVLERLVRETVNMTNFEYRSALLRGEEHKSAFCGATAFFMPTQPSIGESFGLTVIEALSKGVPVITSTAGAPAEILEIPGRLGIGPVGAACNSLEEYETAMLNFSHRSPERTAMVQEFALKRYSSNVVVDKMLGYTMEKLGL